MLVRTRVATNPMAASQWTRSVQMKNGIVYASFMSCLLVSCAAQVVMEETQSPTLRPHRASMLIKMETETRVSSSAHYSSIIRKGSRWAYFGTIEWGNIYKPIDQAFTIEGAHVHEAYLVIDNDSLKGFYLPVEKTFSKVNENVLLRFKTIDNGGN